MLDVKQIFLNSPDHELVFIKLPQLEWNERFKISQYSIDGKIDQSCVIGHQVSIGQSSVVSPYVVIEDNVIIGKNCLIRSGALIRSGTIIGDNCVIGHNAEIKHAFVCDEAKIQGNAFVGDSIIGKGARVGTGCVTSNRRFDQKIVDWHTVDGKVSSGHDKLGLILGDYSRLGANVTTNPGTIIGAHTWVSGGNVVGGYVPSKKYIKIGGQVVNNVEIKILTD